MTSYQRVYKNKFELDLFKYLSVRKVISFYLRGYENKYNLNLFKYESVWKVITNNWLASWLVGWFYNLPTLYELLKVKFNLFSCNDFRQLVKTICKLLIIYTELYGFVSDPGDRGSISCRVIPKTQKIVLDAALLNALHYKV